MFAAARSIRQWHSDNSQQQQQQRGKMSVDDQHTLALQQTRTVRNPAPCQPLRIYDMCRQINPKWTPTVRLPILMMMMMTTCGLAAATFLARDRSPLWARTSSCLYDHNAEVQRAIQASHFDCQQLADWLIDCNVHLAQSTGRFFVASCWCASAACGYCNCCKLQMDAVSIEFERRGRCRKARWDISEQSHYFDDTIQWWEKVSATRCVRTLVSCTPLSHELNSLDVKYSLQLILYILQIAQIEMRVDLKLNFRELTSTYALTFLTHTVTLEFSSSKSSYVTLAINTLTPSAGLEFQQFLTEIEDSLVYLKLQRVCEL